jgi:hypothetical protein
MDVKVTSKMEPGRDLIATPLDEDHVTMLPAWIEFEVEGLPWIVRGVIEHEADSTDPECDAVPEITEITIRRRPGGPEPSPDMIRGVKLGEIKRRAIDGAALHYLRQGNQLVRQFEKIGDPTGATRRMAMAKRGRSATREDFELAAAAYRAAVGEERTDLLVAVGQALYVSTATAGRRIAKAREAGLLEVDE